MTTTTTRRPARLSQILHESFGPLEVIGSLVIVAGTLLVATRKTTVEPMVEAPKGDVAFAKLGGGVGAPAAGGGGLPARDEPMSAFVDIDMDAEEHCLTDEAVSSAVSSLGADERLNVHLALGAAAAQEDVARARLLLRGRPAAAADSSDGSCPSRGETVPNSLESETAVLTVHFDGDDDEG